MDRAALRLSLMFGGGDLHWFDGLSREDQTRLLAYERVLAGEQRKKQPGGEQLPAELQAALDAKRGRP